MYLVVLVILGMLVVLGAMIAYHALLREQNFQIEAAVAKLVNGNSNYQRFGKFTLIYTSILMYLLIITM